jgi:Secretion system C-terminal sorting domain
MKNITQKLCLSALLFTALNAYCQVPKLSSFPSAAPTIFLDFDGHRVQYAGWQNGNPFVCAAAVLTTAQITEIFNRVSEDYRPFAVNVTTDSTKFIAAPLAQRMRVIVTPTSAWYNAPGVAYTNSFTWGDDAPCFVFSDKYANNPKSIAESCSHESGHTLGLSHQARYSASCVITEQYNSGTGTGETSWAPIMGSSYNRNMTGWNVGPTPYDCVITQDNISIITTNNGFGFRADDYSETMNTSTASINPNAINTSGIITTTSDKDAFKITISQNSNLHVEATPFNLGANADGSNLDIMLSLYNSSNVLIRSYNPITTMNVVVDTTLAIGTYYLVVDGTGNNNTSQYGSLGSYTITGFSGVLAIHSVALQGKNINNKHQLNWNIISDEPIITQVLEASSNAIDFEPIMTDATGIKNFDYTPSKSGTLFYRLKVTSSIGESSYSNIVALKANGNEKLFTVSTLVQQDIKVTATENYTYHLYDANARLITSGTERKGISNINIENLPTGMYILQMMNENYKQTERIIKQ